MAGNEVDVWTWKINDLNTKIVEFNYIMKTESQFAPVLAILYLFSSEMEAVITML